MGYLHDKRRKALSRLLIRHGIPTTFQLCDSRVLSGTPNKTQEFRWWIGATEAAPDILGGMYTCMPMPPMVPMALLHHGPS